jgi:hypothetical protein
MHKGCMGRYLTWIDRNEFKKVAVSQIALMGWKTVSFGTVMATAWALLITTVMKAVAHKMLWGT